MAKHGYWQSQIVLGLWKHDNTATTFTLVVDYFGIKFLNTDDTKHLVKALQQYYKIMIDWTGTKYIGLTFDWDYTNHRVHLSMPGYVQKALEKFQHP